MKSNVNYGEFESKISDLIVSVQQAYFTNYTVAQIMNVDKSTVDKQIKRKSIPAEYFEKYLAAWKQITEKPQTPEMKKIKDDKWNSLKDTAIKFLEELLSSINPFYLMDYGSELTYKSFLEDTNALAGKSARFPYLIDKCFDAFATITLNDVFFCP